MICIFLLNTISTDLLTSPTNMNRLRIPVARRPRKLQSALGLGSGPEGRIEKLRRTVTALFRHERLEGSHRLLDESRGYAELVRVFRDQIYG